jgi:hypothetical protein
MARRREQKQASPFRFRLEALAAEPDWRGYEHIHGWLEKLLRRPIDAEYTPAERAAVSRIIAARTPFEGWGGFGVPELIQSALRYVADMSYEDEVYLKELAARRPARLRLDDMRAVIALCRIAGVNLPIFRPPVDTFDEAA